MALLTSALLAKAAMPWAGKLALSGFTKVIRRPRAARAAAKRTAEVGIRVTAKSLRIWLARKDTGEQLRTCNEASLDQAAGRLACMMPGTSAEERRRNALQVLSMVMEESVRAADASQAALLVGSWGLVVSSPVPPGSVPPERRGGTSACVSCRPCARQRKTVRSRGRRQ
ncbi:hypothetical protein [Streptomyces enissocaesilis]